jgi:hypothetical protein
LPTRITEDQIELSQPFYGEIRNLLACIQSRKGHGRIQIIKRFETHGLVHDEPCDTAPIRAVRSHHGHIRIAKVLSCKRKNGIPIPIENQFAALQTGQVPVRCVVRRVSLEKNDSMSMQSPRQRVAWPFPHEELTVSPKITNFIFSAFGR